VRFWIALVLLLVGCDKLFGLQRVPAESPDAAPGNCRLVDDFNGSVVDPMWATDPGPGVVTITTTGGDLVMAPPPSIEGYDGIHTFLPIDVTGMIVHIDAKQPLNPGPGEIHLVAEVDPDAGGDNYYMIFASNGYIGFRVTKGSDDETGAQYSAIYDRYWRMRFELDGLTMAFETSRDDQDWRLRRQIPVTVPLDSLHISLGAGTYNGGIANPGEGHFDDFSVCPTL